MDFDRIINKFNETADALSQKIGSAFDSSKQKYAISKKKKELDSVYRELGRVIYDNRDDLAKSSETILSLCTSVSEKKAEIEELEQKLNEFENKKICPECNNVTADEAEFCSRCGKKL